MKCPQCNSILTESCPLENKVKFFRCGNRCYLMTQSPDGSQSEEFDIYLGSEDGYHLTVSVDNRIEGYFDKRRAYHRKEYAILRIDGWELKRYNFRVPFGTTDLGALEKQKGLAT